MAAGRIDIILAAKPEALIDGLQKGQAAIKTFDAIAGQTVRNNEQFFGQLGSSMAVLSGVAKTAFESINKSVEGTGNTTSKETAKILGNVSAIVDGVAIGATSFNEFQSVAVTALQGISSAFPAVTGAVASMAGPIGLAVGAIGALVTGYFAFTAAAEENSRALDDQKAAITAAEVEAGVLFKKLKDGNLTYSEKSKLINEINDKYGSHLKYIQDEKKFVGELDRVYKQVIESIKLKFAIQANEKEIERIVGQIQANEKLIAIQQKSLEYYKKFDSGGTSGASVPFNAKKEVERLQSDNKALEKEANDLLSKSAEFSKTLRGIFTDAPTTGGGKKKVEDLGIFPDIFQFTAFAINAAKSFITGFEKEIQQINSSFSLIPNSAKDEAEANIKSIEKALQKMGELGFSSTNKYVQEFQERLSQAKTELDNANIEDGISNIAKALEENSAKFKFIPDGELKKAQNDVRILTEGLELLGQAGFRDTSPLVVKWTDDIKLAKAAVEDLKEVSKIPDGGFTIPLGDLNTSGVSSESDRPKDSGFDFTGEAKKAGDRVLKTAINFDLADPEEVKNNIANLQRELNEQQEVFRSAADKKTKEAAKERIALIREEIAAEKERGDAFASTSKNIFNSIRNEIKALLAKAVAYSILNALQTGPLGFVLAPAAGAATSALFDKLIPKLDVGTNQVLSSGLAIIHAGEEVRPATVAGGGYSERRSREPIPIYGSLSAMTIKLASDVGNEKYQFIK